MDTKQLENEIANLQERRADLTTQLNEVSSRLREEEAAQGAALLAGNDAKNKETIADLKDKQAGLNKAIALADGKLLPLRHELAERTQATELARIRDEFNERARVLVDELCRDLKDIQTGQARIHGTKAEIIALTQRADLAEYREIINGLVTLLRFWDGQENVIAEAKLKRSFDLLDDLTARIAQPDKPTEGARADLPPN